MESRRLFVALDLTDEVREDLTAWGRAELVDPALKPVRPESLHVTLVFLGNKGAGEAEEIAEMVVGTKVSAVSLRLEDPARVPKRGRPGLFALPAPSSEASELQRGLCEGLV